MSNMAVVMFAAAPSIISSHSKFALPIVYSSEFLRTKGKCFAISFKSRNYSLIGYKFHDPIPEFAGSEIGKFKTHLLIQFNPKRHRPTPYSRLIRVYSLSSQGAYKSKKEWVADWVSKNDDLVRAMPIFVGGISLLAVLLNRAVSGIAAVADASSSQSRADLLTLGLAVTNIMNGLVWLSIRPKSITVVDPNGVECRRIHPDLRDYVVSELLWAWESLSDATCCRSLVIIYDGLCILQIGYAAAAAADASGNEEAIIVDAKKLIEGSLYKGVAKSGSQSYLANLSLYPGKTELPFLPSNTQAVILQPLGDRGIAIVGGDTIRGFTTSDQAWISLIGEKLDATLASKIPSAAVQE